MIFYHPIFFRVDRGGVSIDAGAPQTKIFEKIIKSNYID